MCDAYEAMTTARSYCPAIARDLACQELRECAGAQFDPAVVEAFLAVVDESEDERTADAAYPAVTHIRTLLEASTA